MTNDQTAMLARYGIDYAEAMERFAATSPCSPASP